MKERPFFYALLSQYAALQVGAWSVPHSHSININILDRSLHLRASCSKKETIWPLVWGGSRLILVITDVQVIGPCAALLPKKRSVFLRIPPDIGSIPAIPAPFRLCGRRENGHRPSHIETGGNGPGSAGWTQGEGRQDLYKPASDIPQRGFEILSHIFIGESEGEPDMP